MKTTESNHGQQVWQLVQNLQNYFKEGLLACDESKATEFEKVSWLRDAGEHGGGWRYVASELGIFNRASVNISQVQYEDLPDRKLRSATALSTIVHPENPLAPSTHMHFSWTSLKGGKAYWRLMADLNPAQGFKDDKKAFEAAFQEFAGDHLQHGMDQGDKYFKIPELDRTRGVSHFYLEQFDSGNFSEDFEYTQRFAKGIMKTYCEILTDATKNRIDFDDQDRQKQLEYHSMYLFQVLTLDRGTTSGMLAHNQNDLGIMGSLPRFVDKRILQGWLEKMSDLKKPLLQGIVDAIPESGEVHNETKLKLIDSIRQFYQNHPEALDAQARGFVLPSTVTNHE